MSPPLNNWDFLLVVELANNSEIRGFIPNTLCPSDIAPYQGRNHILTSIWIATASPREDSVFAPC